MKTRSTKVAGVALGSLLALSIAGCAAPPRPSVMADAEHARTTPAATEASKLAPAAYAHAEQLRKSAEEAYEAEDFVGAQLLAERAIAAYQHAHALSRTVRAGNIREEAELSLREAKEKLARTEQELAQVLAEAGLLEKRIQVARDALPITPSSPTANYKRELARLASSRALALDARLLCAAAKLLDNEAKGLEEAQALVAEVDAKLAAPSPHPAPIDEASRARARCLSSLTAARRTADASSTLGQADALLSTLSSMGALDPVRDDRGVVVTLRDVFRGNALSRESSEKLRELGRVATAHPAFPLQVVVHAAGPSSERPRQEAQGAEVAKALVEAGARSARIHIEAAGTSRPVVDASVARDRLRNDRIEIVFVNPGG